MLIPFALGWSAQNPPPRGTSGPTAVPAYRQANTVAVLTVRGAIDGITLRSLERRIRRARDHGADAVVLDLDTPGGALEATLDICHLIRTEAPANTVAWINPKAYSAGTIIALACREIVTAPGSTFGDAAPVSPFGPIPITERAKLESPLLAEVVDSARRNHYDEKLVQAFVSVGVELWMIENNASGERVFVDREEFRTVFDTDPPSQLTPVAPPGSVQSQQAVKPWFESMMPPEAAGGKAIGPDDLAQLIELEQSRPSSRTQLTEADRGKWTVVKQVISTDRLLVVKPHDAAAYGLTAATVADDEELKAYFGGQTVVRYDRAWSESLAQFLINPIVRGVLLVIFVVCLLFELAAPGMGVFGATAGLSLLIVIGAPWLAGMAQWWEIMLILVGLAFIGAELFVIPGFGVAGITGAICLLVGMVGTFVSDDLSTPAGQSDLATGLTATLTAMLAAGVAVWLIFRQVESIPLLGHLILKTEIAETAGEASEPGLLEAIGPGDRSLEAGAVGVAGTDLRPAGRADFDGRLVDVKSIGDYIDRGKRVRIVSVGRFVIEVEETE